MQGPMLETPVLARIRDHLRAGGAAFEELQHAPAGSAAEYQRTLGTRLEQQAKALLVAYPDGAREGYAVVTLQAQKRADLGHVAGLLGTPRVRLATREELERVTGCRFGELPPMGRPFGLKLVMDRDLLGEPLVYFNAGSLTTSIRVSPRDLQRLEDPLLL